MSDPQRRWTLGLLIGAVGALVLLAGSLSNLQLGPGAGVPAAALLGMLMPSGGGGGTAPPVMDLVRVLLVIIFWVATPILIIALIVWREFRRSFLRALPTYIVVAILAYLLLHWLRNLAQTRADQLDSVPPSAPPLPAGTPPELPVAPSFVNSPPQWLIVLISLLIVAVLAAIIWWLWSRSRQREIVTPLDRLTEGAQAALDDLRAGADVRDTVLRCYAEMIHVLHEGRGVQRGAGMTAREFEQQLRSAGLGDEHIQRLTRLFERVRYGGGVSSVRDAREAESCLFALVQAYGKVFA